MSAMSLMFPVSLLISLSLLLFHLLLFSWQKQQLLIQEHMITKRASRSPKNSDIISLMFGIVLTPCSQVSVGGPLMDRFLSSSNTGSQYRYQSNMLQL